MIDDSRPSHEPDPSPESSGGTARLPRRDFLRKAATASLLAAAAGWAARSLRDPDGERGKPAPRLLHLPEGGFAVAPSTVHPALGIARGERVEEMVRGAIEQIGGAHRFIRRGDIVVIKPNVAFERAAILGATTNPEVLSALVRVVREAGAAEVRVCDNPIESPESCFVRSGIREAAVASGAELYLPAPGEFETLEVKGAKWIGRWPFFASPFRGATKVIGVAPVKDHNLCRASMTTKNWYGLLGGRRNQFHQDIHGIITDLALMMRPTFVLLDGTRVLFRSGPTGGSLSDVRPGGTIVAGTDSLAVDAFGWDDLLGRASEPRPAYFAQASAKGLGNPDWRAQAWKEERVG
ncbi:MAG: DUF362 domain-containing protein [bacterium]